MSKKNGRLNVKTEGVQRPGALEKKKQEVFLQNTEERQVCVTSRKWRMGKEIASCVNKITLTMGQSEQQGIENIRARKRLRRRKAMERTSCHGRLQRKWRKVLGAKNWGGLGQRRTAGERDHGNEKDMFSGY